MRIIKSINFILSYYRIPVMSIYKATVRSFTRGSVMLQFTDGSDRPFYLPETSAPPIIKYCVKYLSFTRSSTY